MHRRFRTAFPRGYRIGAVLVLLAVVPLIGASWFAVRDVVDARAESGKVEEIDAAVQDLVALSELRTRLLDELNWTAASSGLTQVGLTPELILSLTGIDVPAEAAAATARVDDLVTRIDRPGLSARLDVVRAADRDGTSSAAAGYVDLEHTIAAWSDDRLEGVIAHAGDVSDSVPLIESLQVLEAATIARQAISSEFNGYFEAQFSNGDERAEALRDLIGDSRVRQDALLKIDRLAAPDAAVRSAATAIERSAETSAFGQEIDRYVDANLARSDQPDALTASTVELTDVAVTFQNSNVATAHYFDLVEAAGSDVHAATEAAGARADIRNRLSLAALFGVAIGTIAVGVAGTQVIAWPIRRLAESARSIRDGRSDHASVAPSGPAEVREAALAINEAAAHLALAERQALALAEGDLAHSSLDETGSGSLGASLQSAVRTLADSLQEQEELRHRMSHDASHDGLTQLPNRTASMVRLDAGVKRIAGTSGRLAVLFVDLDGFKEVNDELGHLSGDEVLQAVGRRLACAVQPDDHVGRVGGDEFVIIVEPVHDEAEAFERAAAVHSALSFPIRVGATEVVIGASVGIALTGGATNVASDLLRDADLALYQAKEGGRGRTEVCDDALRAALAHRAELDQALHRALLEDEFLLHFQPVVGSDGRRVASHEVLLRWQRPGHGLVAPDDFIPFAERSDLIIEIDRWVLGEVARRIVRWDAAGLPALPVSVNISARHLASDRFCSNLTSAVDEFGIDPTRLIIEITESAFVEDLSAAADKLRRLRERGFRIAIDDFGTGYTSLGHLKSLPMDILKLDRSYVNDPSAASLVQLIIDTGHLLGVIITAEGVETPEQARTLAAMGADELQGYLFGRPTPEPVRPPRRPTSSTSSGPHEVRSAIDADTDSPGDPGDPETMLPPTQARSCAAIGPSRPPTSSTSASASSDTRAIP